MKADPLPKWTGGQGPTLQHSAHDFRGCGAPRGLSEGVGEAPAGSLSLTVWGRGLLSEQNQASIF